MMKNQKYLPEDYTITVARTIEEVEAIRDVWEKMQTQPNSDIDFFLTVVNSLSHILRPHVILLSRDNIPLTLAVGRIEDHEFRCNFGYKTIYQTTVRTYTLIYQGILGHSSNECDKILFAEFLNIMEQGEVDLIYLSNIRFESHLYELATTIPEYLSRDSIPISNTHWIMTLPEDIDTFFKARSSKHRTWLRRIVRILENDYPGKVDIRFFSEEKDLDQLFTDAELISQRTYQRALDAGFINNEVTRKIYSLHAKKSWLRAYILYIEAKPSAFWIGKRYGDTFYLIATGYDPALKNYELGTILFLKMIEDLCSNKEFRFLDFGLGDALYKRRFGNQSWNETSIYIFPRSLGGTSLNVLRTLTSIVHKFSVLILARTKLLEKVKRAWRNILSK